MMNADEFRKLVEAAKADVEVFARELLREPLWDHQLALVRSTNRFVCACSGRRAGKSRSLAVKAIHLCLVKDGAKVLIVSAGDDAARELLTTCSELMQQPIVEELVEGETTHVIRFKTGSTIRSVPASQKQVRGQEADLLIIDEACFVDEEVISAAKWVISANRDPQDKTQLVMTSTPYGRLDRFFATMYRAGLRGDLGVASFHWPSTISPLVDDEVLRVFRETSTDREYRAEVLAEWVEDAGSLFPTDLLDSITVDLADDDLSLPVYVAGVDWGRTYDSCALVGLSRLPDGRYAVTLCVEKQTKPHHFLPLVTEQCRTRSIGTVIPEENGVGGSPADQLAEKIGDLRLRTTALLLTTTQETKAQGFGYLERLFRDGQLVIDRRFVALLPSGRTCWLSERHPRPTPLCPHDDCKRRRSGQAVNDLGDLNAGLRRESFWKPGESF